MTTINLDHQVIDVEVAADQAINSLFGAIAKSITTLGYADVMDVDGLWAVWLPSGEDEVLPIPGTVTTQMLPLETLLEAFSSKGWITASDSDGVHISYPEITTEVIGEDDD